MHFHTPYQSHKAISCFSFIYHSVVWSDLQLVLIGIVPLKKTTDLYQIAIWNMHSVIWHGLWVTSIFFNTCKWFYVSADSMTTRNEHWPKSSWLNLELVRMFSLLFHQNHTISWRHSIFDEAFVGKGFIYSYIHLFMYVFILVHSVLLASDERPKKFQILIQRMDLLIICFL